jgi:hypothetical protein
MAPVKPVAVLDLFIFVGSYLIVALAYPHNSQCKYYITTNSIII